MAEEKRVETECVDLPVVDISAFMDKGSNMEEHRKDVIDAIEYGFSNIGFILIKGHDLDSQWLSTIFDINEQFFTKLASELLESTIVQSPVPRGYAAINSENFGALIGQIRPNDLNCKYRIGPEYHNNLKIQTLKHNNNDESLDNDNYYGSKGARCLLYPNIWPSIIDIDEKNKIIVEKFKLSLLEIYDKLYKISQILFDIFECIFVDKLEHKNMNFNRLLFDKHTSILSTNYYPTKSEIENKYKIDIKSEENQMAISEHTDIDIFTIIIQNNNEGGVEIFDQEKNRYLSIPYDANNNYLIVNVGDGFQYLTNNKWKSTKHRVLIPQNNISRQVIAFFAAFNHDAMMTPCIQRKYINDKQDTELDDNRDQNNLMTYFEWRKKRIRKVVKQLKKLKQKK